LGRCAGEGVGVWLRLGQRRGAPEVRIAFVRLKAAWQGALVAYCAAM